MTPHMTIEVFGPLAKISANVNNEVITKHTTLDDINKLLNASRKEIFATPFFPFWNISYKKQGNTVTMLNCMETGFLSYQVRDKGHFKFQVPYLYFHWTFNHNPVRNDYAKTELTIYGSYEYPSEQTILYLLNLNNVSEHGQLCLGSVEMPNLFKNFNEIYQFQKSWLGAQRNVDLVDWTRLNPENNKVFPNETAWASSGIIVRKYGTIQEAINIEN